MVIGETGCGKSSLLNKLSGVRYLQIESDSGEVHVERSKAKTELFVSARGRDSVTQRTRIHRTQFFLDPNITIYLIDTPGTNDGSEEAVSHNHSTDVQLKLQRLQFVHLLVVCVPGLSPSGRIKHSTRDFLRSVSRMFEDTSEGPGPRQVFWDHVVLVGTLHTHTPSTRWFDYMITATTLRPTHNATSGTRPGDRILQTKKRSFVHTSLPN